MQSKAKTLVNLIFAIGLLKSSLSVSGGSATWDFTTDPTQGPYPLHIIQSGFADNTGNSIYWKNTGGNPGGFLGLTWPLGNSSTIVIFPDLDNGKALESFEFECDVRIGNPQQGERPADGFSLNFARKNDPIFQNLSISDFASLNLVETGSRTGIAVCFDTWSGNDLPDGPDIEGIIVRVDNVTILKYPMPTQNGECDDPTSLETGPRDAPYWTAASAAGTMPSAAFLPAASATLCWQHLSVKLDDQSKLTVTWKGTTVIDHYQTKYFPVAGGLILAGRTGAANGNAHFDNITLATFPPAVDLQSPSDPTDLTTFEISANHVALKWSPSSDNSERVAYELEKDGLQLSAIITDTKYVDTDVTPNSTHTYRIRAVDVAGNKSGYTTALAVTASDTTFGDFICSVNNSLITITGYIGGGGDVIIPARINEMPVVHIGNGAFTQRSGIKNISIPDSIVSIGNAAFQGCAGLSGITLPDSIATIGESAFESCSAMTSVILGNSVNSIGAWAFGYCNSLTSVTLPASITSIGNFAFGYCQKISSITVPQGVTLIGFAAFVRCPALSDILVDSLNANYCSINGVLFDKNQKTLICYPNGKSGGYMVPVGVTTIREQAFFYCTGLESITFPDSVTVIEGNAFSGCSQLTGIVLPNSLTTIGWQTFSDCGGLTSVRLPKNVSSIGSGPFAGCKRLENIWVDSSSSFYRDTDGVLFDKGQTILIQCPGARLGSYDVPATVTRIGGSAFSTCLGLTAINMPEGIKTIEYSAFSNCSGLTSICISNSVTALSGSVFAFCSSLSSVHLGNGIASIEYDTFYQCTSLTSLIVPPNVNRIANWAFESCTKLERVTIPSSVTSIEYAAFWNCPVLTGLYFLGNAPSISANVFYNDNNATVYRLDRATGWGDTFGERPTAKWVGTLAEPVITWYTPADIVYGTALSSVQLNASANVTGTLLYSPPIGAYVTAGAAQILTVTLIPDDPVSYSAVSKTVTITVGKAALTVAADDKTKIFGSPNPALTASYKGFIGSDTPANLDTPPTLSTPATAVSPVGTYPIIVSGAADSDYAFSYANGTLTVSTTPVSDFTYKVDGSTITITGYTGPDGGVVIPDFIEGKPVTVVGDNAFGNRYGLTSLILPNSLVRIGNWAFGYCSQLASVTLPSSVIAIGDYAFYGCSGLLTAEIGQNVATIGYFSFGYCQKLSSITVPKSVTLIGNNAFNGCSALSEFVVDSLNPNYSSINGVLFDKKQTTLFSYPCGKIGGYEIPAGVITVKDQAFYNCLGLTSITFPDSLTSIGGSAFSGCSQLTDIVLPNSLTYVGWNAFSSCSGLTYVRLPKNVTSIGSGSFAYCEHLESIQVDSGNPYYTSKNGVLFDKGQTILLQCPGAMTGSYDVPAAVTRIGGYAFSGCHRLTAINMSDGLKSIEWGAFQSCSGLTSINIPNSVTALSGYTFAYCSSLSSIHLGGGITSIESDMFYQCNSLMSFIVPSGVNRLASWAFEGCPKLARITIPNSVTSIDNGAFNNCPELTGLYFIGDAPGIGANVFYNDNNATVYRLAGTAGWGDTFGGRPTEIWRGSLPEPVITWSSPADIVYGTALSSVQLNASTEVAGTLLYSPPIGAYVPAGSAQTLTVTLIPDDPVSYNAVSKSVTITVGKAALTVAADDKTKIFGSPNPKLTASYKGFVGSDTTANLDTLPTLSTKATATSSVGTYPIEISGAADSDYTFSYANGTLTVVTTPVSDFTFKVDGSTITITGYTGPDGGVVVPDFIEGKPVTIIGDNAFGNRYGLTSLILPNSLVRIGNWAFGYCSQLTSVTLPSSVIAIGDYAFYGCSGLLTAEIGQNVATIGYFSFGYCQKLSSITVPKSVTLIGNIAFTGCSALSEFVVDSLNPNYSSINGVLFDKKQTTLLSYPCGKTGGYEIPAGVITVKDQAFYYCSGLTSISYPEGLTSIGGNAFSGCSQLTDIVLPNSLTSIGWNAFSSCSGLSHVRLSKNVTSIGSGPFSDCEHLENIQVDSDNSYYTDKNGVLFDKGQTVLIQCPGAKTGSYDVPVTVTRIGDSAFASCRGLAAISMSEGIKTLDWGAFRNCSGLTSINVPNSVTALSSWAFAYCSSLSSVHLGNGISSIEYGTFTQCASLKTLIVPSSVTRIANWAFQNCNKLERVTFPSSMASIENGAFYYCPELTGLYFVGNAPNIGSDVFYNDNKAIVYRLASAMGWGDTFGGRPTAIWIGSLAEPVITWSKPADIFYGTALSSVQLNASANVAGTLLYSLPIGAYVHAGTAQTLTVTLIPDDPISYNAVSKSVAITVGKAAMTVAADDKTKIFGSPNPKLTASCKGFVGSDTAANLDTPPIITTTATATSPIGTYPIVVSGAVDTDYTFTYVNGTLKIETTPVSDFTYKVDGSTITITGYTGPDGGVVVPDFIEGKPVTLIGDNAFGNRYGLTSIILPNSLVRIGNWAFGYCSQLASVTLPASVIAIGEYAFYGCGGLLTAEIGENIATVGAFSFGYCQKLSSITVPKSATLIGDCAFAGCSALSEIVVDSLNPNYNSINGVLFDKKQTTLLSYPCGKTGGYAIPAGVITIRDQAFYYCSGLTSISYPEGLTSIGGNAFSGCSQLTDIVLPNSLTSIGWNAFSSCSGLSHVRLSKNVTSIGSGPFSDCEHLENIQVDSDNSYYTDKNGVLFDKGQTVLIQCPGAKTGSYDVPATVTRISSYAFSTCRGLAAIGMSEGIKTIEWGAFRNCSGLKSISLPNSVTSLSGYLFGNCSSLSSVHLGNGITSIENDMFYQCTSLTSLVVPSSVKRIASWAFESCTKLARITLPSNVTSLEYAAFWNCPALTGLYFLGNAPGLGTDVFRHDDNATIYRLASASGWGDTFGGRPVVIWIGSLAEPVITWNSPTDITTKTPLSFTQLNASANKPGTFSYSPAAGTFLPVGLQTLTATFIPDDPISYNAVSKSVQITVASSSAVLVTTAADSGPGSLRYSLENLVSDDIITFDPAVFPIKNPTTIALKSGLPGINQKNVTIDASNAGVIVDGSGISASGTSGFSINSPNNTIRGMQIVRFPSYGIYLGPSAVGNTIGGDRSKGEGPLGQGNLIGGNGSSGIFLSGAQNTIIAGNMIGVDISGTHRLANGQGIGMYNGASHNLIGGAIPGYRNIISANNGSGISISGSTCIGNIIEGNYIGTDLAGVNGLGNTSCGIYIAAPGNIVGGIEPGVGNLISDNQPDGIQISGTTASDNTVQGNFIGTDYSGTASLGNYYRGVAINSAQNNLIGGDEPGACNVISGNYSDGIILNGNGNAGQTTGNVILGNSIGTQVDNATHLGNGAYGIFITGSANDNTLGSQDAVAANKIAFNASGGIYADSGSGNWVRANVIHENFGMGIDIGFKGSTPNDNRDKDNGANGLQNYPVLIAAIPGDSATTIRGWLNSTPATIYQIQFYVNESKDASSVAQGRQWVGTMNTLADANGNASFSCVLPILLKADQNVTATATDPAHNTSEFSAVVPVTATSTQPLRPVSAFAVAGRTQVDVVFNGLLDFATATTPANYSIPGAIIDSAILQSDGRSVLLKISGLTDPNFTLQVENVLDGFGSPIASGTSIDGAVFKLSSKDVGTSGDPAEPGSVLVFNQHDFNVTAGGSDIWSRSDAFHFVYEELSGDFDTRVQVTGFLARNSWSKAELMAREDLSPNSRMVALVMAPSEGANVFSCQFRPQANVNTTYYASDATRNSASNPWLRLKRVGSAFTSYKSDDGIKWTQLGQIRQTYSEKIYVGVATSSHNNSLGQSTVVAYRNYASAASSLPTMAISVSRAFASESIGDGLAFLSSSASPTRPLVVNFSLGGTAMAGSDYRSPVMPAIIPNNAIGANISIVPLPRDIPTGIKTLTLTLSPDAAYEIVDPASATVQILDDRMPIGTLRREIYSKVAYSQVSDLIDSSKYPRYPDQVDYITSIESKGLGINYGVRLSGFVIPPTSGGYTFYLASDDESQLYLSTDDTLANKQLIAREPIWNNSRDWTTPTRRSNGENISKPINLVAGRRYFLEVLQKQGSGGEHVAVAWRKPGHPIPAKGSDPIGGEFLAYNPLPKVQIDLPENGANFASSPSDIVLRATASDANGTVTRVDFYMGAQLLGSSTANPYSFTWKSAPAGQYSITAVAFDNTGESASSMPVIVSVGPMPLNIASQPQKQTVLAGHSATFSVAANGATPHYQWYFYGSTLPPSDRIHVDVYNGFDPAWGGAPFSGLAGSFACQDVMFGTDTDLNWHPFGLSQFGAVITGLLEADRSESYLFSLNSDDGSLLFIDDSPVIDNGGSHSPGSSNGYVALAAGFHTFEIQFFESFGGESGVDLILPPGISYASPPDYSKATLLTGETGSDLTINNVTPDKAGLYAVTIENPAGTITTLPVRLTVNMAPIADFSYELIGSAIAIVKYTGSGGNVVVPATINGLPVTIIGYQAFYNCSSVTGVIMPASLTSIENGAFSGCPKLNGLFFEGNAPNLGSDVFYNDNNAIVYHLAAALGWGANYGGRPTAIWGGFFPGSYSLNMRKDQTGTITVSRLVSIASDPYGNGISVATVNGMSLHGGSINWTGGTITYTPASGYEGDDSFAYTLINSRGATVDGTVNITITPPATSPNQLGLNRDLTTGIVTLHFAGIPFFAYDIEACSDTTTWKWDWLATKSAAANGVIEYTDEHAKEYSLRLYRAVFKR